VSVALLLLVVMSSVFVVQVKYQSRILFSQQQVLVKDKDAVDVEWGRLQLELATWGSQGRVSKIAEDVLDMHVPSISEIRVLRY